MLEKTCPIVGPLIAIIIANEIRDSLPISAVDRVEEMFRVQPDLMLSSPEPEQIQADAERNDQRPNECSTKCNRHIRERIVPGES